MLLASDAFKKERNTMTQNEKNILCTRTFLESYGANKKMLNMLNYEKEYFGDIKKDDSLALPFGDEILVKTRMYDVRRFIASLPDGNEKFLLFYHYVRGYSVEKCSELLGIGRTSAFRLRRRALASAAEKYTAQKDSALCASA